MSGTTEKTRPQPVRIGKGEGKGTGKGKGKGTGKGTGKGRGKGKGNLTQSVMTSNNVATQKRRPKPVRPKTKNNVSKPVPNRVPRTRAKTQNNVSIEDIIAQRIREERKSANASVKNKRTFEERKKSTQKIKGTPLNVNTGRIPEGMSPSNETQFQPLYDKFYEEGMERDRTRKLPSNDVLPNNSHNTYVKKTMHTKHYIPPGLTPSEEKIFIDLFEKSYKEGMEKHRPPSKDVLNDSPADKRSYSPPYIPPDSPSDSPTDKRSYSPPYIPSEHTS